ncbi:MAG TPA: glycosyltransferase [Candidatus Eisenbergiella merdigallinarum]|uniref:Glycosyltransferase n=1 Tax=Candidatus Eisenbergiella merdigallinarum TaxID=2838552 RepID=A0A9D2MR69_9FIRM|nr:glycosyltransferase [Candidatus Eisenbergiella merdigallinarum]
MGEVLLSVIVPVYNIEDCLERCVNSIRSQTERNLEILLVDDGSTDGSGALCDRLAKEDRRIRVFHKENGGSSSARNLGIERARGEWLGFVDSDDWIDPEMYALLLQEAAGRGADIAQASRDEIDEDGNRRPDVCAPPEAVTFCPAEDFLRELLLHRGDCSFCTKLVRRSLFVGKRFPEGRLNEDFRLLVEMLSEGAGVCILPQQMYHVFYRLGSNTRKKDPDDFSRVFLDIVDNADFVEELVGRRYPQLKAEAVRFGLFQRLDYLLHIPIGRMTSKDPFYRNVIRYLRRHVRDTLTNPWLSSKNRVYLLLLTAAPKTVRKAHARLRK